LSHQSRHASKGRYQALGFGGGNSHASHADWKPCRLCAPSQNGFFSESPQRHRLMLVRPAKPN
jgi:hypothetical protein